jgi:hypothetical protein
MPVAEFARDFLALLMPAHGDALGAICRRVAA